MTVTANTGLEGWEAWSELNSLINGYNMLFPFSFAIHIHLVYNIDKSLFMSQPNKNSTVSIP